MHVDVGRGFRALKKFRNNFHSNGVIILGHFIKVLAVWSPNICWLFGYFENCYFVGKTISIMVSHFDYTWTQMSRREECFHSIHFAQLMAGWCWESRDGDHKLFMVKLLWIVFDNIWSHWAGIFYFIWLCRCIVKLFANNFQHYLNFQISPKSNSITMNSSV